MQTAKDTDSQATAFHSDGEKADSIQAQSNIDCLEENETGDSVTDDAVANLLCIPADQDVQVMRYDLGSVTEASGKAEVLIFSIINTSEADEKPKELLNHDYAKSSLDLTTDMSEELATTNSIDFSTDMIDTCKSENYDSAYHCNSNVQPLDLTKQTERENEQFTTDDSEATTTIELENETIFIIRTVSSPDNFSEENLEEIGKEIMLPVKSEENCNNYEQKYIEVTTKECEGQNCKEADESSDEIAKLEGEAQIQCEPKEGEKLDGTHTDVHELEIYEESGMNSIQGLSCELCGNTFDTKKRLDNHRRYKHYIGGKDYKCEFCAYSTPYLSTFKRHRDMHQYREKKMENDNGKLSSDHMCEKCGKCFVSRGNLFTHVKAHINPPSFKCMVCGKICSQKGNLKSHMLRHQKPKVEKREEDSSVSSNGKKKRKHKPSQYPCGNCDKVFRWRGDLSRHVKTIHKGIKNFVCSQCNKRFADSFALKQHELMHGEGKPFKCLYCYRSYSTKYSHQQHVMNKHQHNYTTENNVSGGIKESSCL